ncbi:hypothetical protein [Ferruginibacter albus]|uniref:hypothetical protein n=1 Tax=Ferruginibacter albus TaxID=2875540 RepID=UPI001CC72A61|nr:hypothetical protein [Ferruginibacter albus]UAY53224.1 hypothetical protein K9M53_06025 [Ferruginibacter albus]
MTDKEQYFYSQIGLITVEFSNLENHIRELIGLLINSDDEFINLLLTEDNGIYQNLKLLVKLSRYRHIEEDKIQLLHNTIDKLRINRNLFIHGLWSKFEENGQMTFVCEVKKIEFKKGKYGVTTYMNKFFDFKIEDFEKEIGQIRDCLNIIKPLIDEVENQV